MAIIPEIIINIKVHYRERKHFQSHGKLTQPQYRHFNVGEIPSQLFIHKV